MNIEYSVVIPVYNSGKSLEELTSRLKIVFNNLSKNFEIILVDDNSQDDSWAVIKKLHDQEEKIRGIKLTKNFGQHSALMCGFNHVNGKYIITMDDDLQNPPEEIPKLIEKMEKTNTDVVTGIRKNTHTSLFKSLSSGIYHHLLKKIYDKPKGLKFGSFYLIKRNVILNIIEYKGPYPLLVASILDNTSNITSIKVEHHKRKYGKSNYSMGKSFKHYHDLIVNHSTLPLKFIYFIGIITVIGAIIGMVYIIINAIMGNFGVAGWPSLMVINILFGGLILLSLGIIGEYLARVLNEANDSEAKQYRIEEKI